MKRLSDYTGDEAIEKSGEVMEAFFSILEDPETTEEISKNLSVKTIGRVMAKHKEEAYKMMSIVDDTPITAQNAFPRFFALFTDIASDPFFVDFFSAAAAKTEQ